MALEVFNLHAYITLSVNAGLPHRARVGTRGRLWLAVPGPGQEPALRHGAFSCRPPMPPLCKRQSRCCERETSLVCQALLVRRSSRQSEGHQATSPSGPHTEETTSLQPLATPETNPAGVRAAGASVPHLCHAIFASQSMSTFLTHTGSGF